MRGLAIVVVALFVSSLITSSLADCCANEMAEAQIHSLAHPMTGPHEHPAGDRGDGERCCPRAEQAGPATAYDVPPPKLKSTLVIWVAEVRTLLPLPSVIHETRFLRTTARGSPPSVLPTSRLLI